MKIFLDVDGVLADFDAGAKKEFGIDLSEENPPRLPYDKLGHDFYGNLPELKNAKEVIKMAKFFDPTYYYLTGTVSNSGCYSGKFEWLKRITKKDPRKRLILCESNNKYLLAGKDRILVDDREKNILGWRAAGGIGILYNRKKHASFVAEFTRTCMRLSDEDR